MVNFSDFVFSHSYERFIGSFLYTVNFVQFKIHHILLSEKQAIFLCLKNNF